MGKLLSVWLYTNYNKIFIFIRKELLPFLFFYAERVIILLQLESEGMLVLGIIRVLTTSDENVLEEHGKQMNEYLNINSDTFCIPDQWNGIYDVESERKALPKIVKLVKEMEESNKYSALTISCAADPALNQCRDNVTLPIIGAGSAGAYAASMIGNQIGVIGITEEVPENIGNILKTKFHSYRHEPSVRKTVDLFSEYSQAKLLNIVKSQVEKGADTILFACTGFSTIKLKKYIFNYLNVPVIDLVEAQAITFRLIEMGEKE